MKKFTFLWMLLFIGTVTYAQENQSFTSLEAKKTEPITAQQLNQAAAAQKAVIGNATNYNDVAVSAERNAKILERLNQSGTAVISTRQGGVATFPTLTDFQNACTGSLTSENFSGGPGAGMITDCGTTVSSAGDSCFAAMEIEEGFNIQATNATTVIYIGDGAIGNSTVLMGASFFAEFTIINFTGMDDVFDVAMTVRGEDSAVAIRIFDTMSNLIDTINLTITPSSENFVGFQSPTAVGSIEIEGANGSGELFGNFMFGDCDTGGGGGCPIASDCNLMDTTPDDATSPNIWDRPVGAGPTISGLGPVSYDVYGPFTVDTAGDYTFDSTQMGWDGYLHLYEICFDPTDQLTNLLAGDDDGPGGVGTSQILDQTLATGVEYYLITSGFSAGDFGDFTNTITGPGAVTCGGGGGGGGATTFMTLMDFQDSCIGDGTLAMEDFVGVNIAPGSAQGCGPILDSSGSTSCYDPGELVDDFNITSSEIGGPADTAVLGSGFLDPGQTEPVAGANFFAEFTIINFTGTDDVTSAGFDLYNFSGVDTDIRLFDSGGTLTDTFTVPGTQNFFAFISDVAISRVEVEGTGGTGELVGNLLFGACATNDTCDDAIAMACGDTETGDTSDYTDTGGFNAAPDAWYSYTGSGDLEFVTFSLCDGNTTYDSLLTVFDSCGGAVVVSNDDNCGLQSEVSFLSDGTTTYYVAVEGFLTNAGPYSLQVTCNPVAANDLCTNAQEISCGSVTAGSTEFATVDDDVASNCDDTFDPTPFNPTVDVVAPGVWYQFTETIPGLISDITLTTCNDADYDTKISVYTGDCGTLTCVAANDDDDDCDSPLFTSTVEFQSDGFSTYYILVHGFGPTSVGNFNLTMDCVPVAPPNDEIANAIDVDQLGFPYTDPIVNMPGATTEAGGTPAGCNNAGVQGVWYKFTPEVDGFVNASITNPGGFSSVTFYSAPDEDSMETDLTLVEYFQNQCVPGNEATILTTAGQAYYAYVANTGSVTDIVIDGSVLGVGDAVVEGFSYYPNPATDELNLSAGTKTIESATIFNILGQEVLREAVGASTSRLNVSNLTSGAYVLKVVVNGEVGIYKILKQ